MRHPTPRAPCPARSHHHRPATATQQPRPRPTPRPQRTIAIRARQPARHQTGLDLNLVRPYREHSASERYTALPDASAKTRREGLRMPLIGKVPPPTKSTRPPAHIQLRRHPQCRTNAALVGILNDGGHPPIRLATRLQAPACALRTPRRRPPSPDQPCLLGDLPPPTHSELISNTATTGCYIDACCGI